MEYNGSDGTNFWIVAKNSVILDPSVAGYNDADNQAQIAIY